MSDAQPSWKRAVQGARATVVFFAGLAGFTYELVGADHPSSALIFLCGGMMSVQGYVINDYRKRRKGPEDGSSDDDE
jgi:4-hydroxybenzoate polyprenyltransferase